MQEYYVTITMHVRVDDRVKLEEWLHEIPWSLLETEDVAIGGGPWVDKVQLTSSGSVSENAAKSSFS